MIKLEIKNNNPDDEYYYNSSVVINFPIDTEDEEELKNFESSLDSIGVDLEDSDGMLNVANIIEHDYDYKGINFKDSLGEISFLNLNKDCWFLEDPSEYESDNPDVFRCTADALLDLDSLNTIFTYIHPTLGNIVDGDINWEDMYWYESEDEVGERWIEYTLESYSRPSELYDHHPSLFDLEYAISEWKDYNSYDITDNGCVIEFVE